MRKEKLILLILLVGILLVFVEARYLHSGILSKKPFAWGSTITLPLMALACLFGFGKSRPLRTAAIVLFVVGGLSGLVGTYFHTDGLKLSRITMLAGTKPEKEENKEGRVERREESEERENASGEKKEEEEPPPPLVALSVTGLALLGLVLLWPEKPGANEA